MCRYCEEVFCFWGRANRIRHYLFSFWLLCWHWHGLITKSAARWYHKLFSQTGYRWWSGGDWLAKDWIWVSWMLFCYILCIAGFFSSWIPHNSWILHGVRHFAACQVLAAGNFLPEWRSSAYLVFETHLASNDQSLKAVCVRISVLVPDSEFRVFSKYRWILSHGLPTLFNTWQIATSSKSTITDFKLGLVQHLQELLSLCVSHSHHDLA